MHCALLRLRVLGFFPFNCRNILGSMGDSTLEVKVQKVVSAYNRAGRKTNFNKNNYTSNTEQLFDYTSNTRAAS